MTRHLIVVSRCPLCGNKVDIVPDGILKANPGAHDCEMVVTRTNLKQYLHSSCWNEMIREKRPYNGKLYLGV